MFTRAHEWSRSQPLQTNFCQLSCYVFFNFPRILVSTVPKNLRWVKCLVNRSRFALGTFLGCQQTVFLLTMVLLLITPEDGKHAFTNRHNVSYQIDNSLSVLLMDIHIQIKYNECLWVEHGKKRTDNSFIYEMALKKFTILFIQILSYYSMDYSILSQAFDDRSSRTSQQVGQKLWKRKPTLRKYI